MINITSDTINQIFLINSYCKAMLNDLNKDKLNKGILIRNIKKIQKFNNSLNNYIKTKKIDKNGC